MWGIHRWPMNSPHKGPVTRKMFPFDYVIMISMSRHNHVLPQVASSTVSPRTLTWWTPTCPSTSANGCSLWLLSSPPSLSSAMPRRSSSPSSQSSSSSSYYYRWDYASLAICEGSPQVDPQVDSPHKGPVMRNFDVCFDASLNKLLNKRSSRRSETTCRLCGISVMNVLCFVFRLF